MQQEKVCGRPLSDSPVHITSADHEPLLEHQTGEEESRVRMCLSAADGNYQNMNQVLLMVVSVSGRTGP